MRLIDANELSLAIDEALKTVSKEVSLSKQLTMKLLADFAHTVLNETPTAKAIPKEWIINWLTKQTIPALHTCDEYEAVNMMLDDWEKENDRD